MHSRVPDRSLIERLSIPSGFFSYRFTVPGVYYYSSGYIDNANVKVLQGVVKVIPREDDSRVITVLVGGIKARLVPGGKYPHVYAVFLPAA